MAWKWLVLPFIVFDGLGTPTNMGVAGWLIFGEGDMVTKQWVWAFLLLTGKAHFMTCKTQKQQYVFQAPWNIYFLVVAFALFQRLSDPSDPINVVRGDEEPVLDPERIDTQEIRDTVSNVNFLAKTLKSASSVLPGSPKTNSSDNPFDPHPPQEPRTNPYDKPFDPPSQ